MLRFSSVLLLSSSVLLAAFAPQSVQAQSWGDHSEYLHHYELFVDGRGRRFLVDPETGEVVGRATRNARFTWRDKRRAQRAFRRFQRNAGWDREYDEYYEDDIRELRRLRRQHRETRNRGRFLDEYELDDMPVGSTRRFDEDRAAGKRRYQEPVLSQTRKNRKEREIQLARLPEPQPTVTRIKPIEGVTRPKFNPEQMAALQVVLDREGFSPGVIDGVWGSNMARALAARKKAHPNKATITSTAKLKAQIAATGGDVFTTYTITKADLTGPFVAAVPVDYAKKARLAALSYTSVAEMLAERFHMSEAFLRKLNPGKSFNTVGTRLKVIAPGDQVRKKVHYIVADKGRRQVKAFDRNGKLVASYPATIGSASTPSPSGTHSIKRIALNPEYTYNPKKNFQQGDNDKILRIAPGPNGPVGSVWIALSKESYGIHGTPNPRNIGKTSSNGCIRLTNWDAQELASLVREGVTVQFVE